MANKPPGVKAPTPTGSARFHARALTAGRWPWLRQDGESAIAYADFIHFLMLPKEERTYAKCAEAAGKSHSLIEKRGQQWSWQLRAAAYEEHYLLLRLESVEAERDQMFKEHKAVTSTALELVRTHLESLIKRIQDGSFDPLTDAGYKMGDIVRLFKEAEQADRQVTLDRTKNAQEAQEHQERLAEKHSDELASLFKDVMEDLELTPAQRQQAESVVKRHLVGVGEEGDQ